MGRFDINIFDILTKVSRPPPLCHQCTSELSTLVKLIPAVTAMGVGGGHTCRLRKLDNLLPICLLRSPDGWPGPQLSYLGFVRSWSKVVGFPELVKSHKREPDYLQTQEQYPLQNLPPFLHDGSIEGFLFMTNCIIT